MELSGRKNGMVLSQTIVTISLGMGSTDTPIGDVFEFFLTTIMDATINAVESKQFHQVYDGEAIVKYLTELGLPEVSPVLKAPTLIQTNVKKVLETFKTGLIALIRDPVAKAKLEANVRVILAVINLTQAMSNANKQTAKPGK
eukprot:scaffold976_cov214-Ochromonas_danica.AAC.7